MDRQSGVRLLVNDSGQHPRADISIDLQHDPRKPDMFPDPSSSSSATQQSNTNHISRMEAADIQHRTPSTEDPATYTLDRRLPTSQIRPPSWPILSEAFLAITDTTTSTLLLQGVDDLSSLFAMNPSDYT